MLSPALMFAFAVAFFSPAHAAAGGSGGFLSEESAEASKVPQGYPRAAGVEQGPLALETSAPRAKEALSQGPGGAEKDVSRDETTTKEADRLTEGNPADPSEFWNGPASDHIFKFLEYRGRLRYQRSLSYVNRFIRDRFLRSVRNLSKFRLAPS